MRKSIKIQSIILFMLLLLISVTEVDAQRKRGTKKRPSKTERVENNRPFADRLWYGSNVNFQLGTGYFLFGINPMVGYKFTDWLSAGPLVIANYSHQKFNSGITYNLKSFDYGVGLFARAKFLEQFFFQAEYDYTSVALPDYNDNGNLQIDPDDPNDILTTREPLSEFFLGLGYHVSNGAKSWGYQVTLMYDILQEDTSSSLPISYRIGFTYNL